MGAVIRLWLNVRTAAQILHGSPRYSRPDWLPEVGKGELACCVYAALPIMITMLSEQQLSNAGFPQLKRQHRGIGTGVGAALSAG